MLHTLINTFAGAVFNVLQVYLTLQCFVYCNNGFNASRYAMAISVITISWLSILPS